MLPLGELRCLLPSRVARPNKDRSRAGPNRPKGVHSVRAFLQELLRVANSTEVPYGKNVGCTWATEWAARGLPMGILPCKLGYPLLPYMETAGSSVGS